MNIRDHLLVLSAAIEKDCPKLPQNMNSSNTQDQMRYGMISDIQQKFAELYGIILRETKNNSLNMDFLTALGSTNHKLKRRVKSILNIVSTLALAIKTKINIAESQAILDSETIKCLNDLAYKCFSNALPALLGQEEFQAQATEFKAKFALGIPDQKSCTYRDYKTGLVKIISCNSGKLVAAILPASEEKIAEYVGMIIKARQLLDSHYNPSTEQVWVGANSSAQVPAKVRSIFQPVPSKQTQQPDNQNDKNSVLPNFR